MYWDWASSVVDAYAVDSQIISASRGCQLPHQRIESKTSWTIPGQALQHVLGYADELRWTWSADRSWKDFINPGATTAQNYQNHSSRGRGLAAGDPLECSQPASYGGAPSGPLGPGPDPGLAACEPANFKPNARSRKSAHSSRGQRRGRKCGRGHKGEGNSAPAGL